MKTNWQLAAEIAQRRIEWLIRPFTKERDRVYQEDEKKLFIEPQEDIPLREAPTTGLSARKSRLKD